MKDNHVRRRLFPKVKVTILEPVKLEVAADLKGKKRRVAAGAALYQIMSTLIFRTTNTDATLIERVIQTAITMGGKTLAVEDPIAGKLSYSKLLTGAAVLGARVKTMFPNETTLGIMLPNANGTAATLLGVMSAGKVPAMLNFTAGAANVLSACKAAEVKHVLCSRAFVTQGKLGALVEEMQREVKFVWLDELRTTISTFEKSVGCSTNIARSSVVRQKTTPLSCSRRALRARRRAWSSLTAISWRTQHRQQRASTSTRATRFSMSCLCSTRSG